MRRWKRKKSRKRVWGIPGVIKVAVGVVVAPPLVAVAPLAGVAVVCPAAASLRPSSHQGM